MEAEYDGVEGVIKIVTNQQLNNENLRPFIQLHPDISYSVETMDNGFFIRSDKFDTEKSYTVIIRKGLRGWLGGEMKEDYEQVVGFGELEPEIKFTNSKAVYLSKRGAKNIEVLITGVQKVKLII